MSITFSNIIESDEFREEFFVAETQARLANMLDERGVSRAELARKLGVSRARITQIFSDDANNLTLRLLARCFLCLGEEPMIISKSDYETLKEAAAHTEISKANTVKREHRYELDAALIAQLLRSHSDLEKIEVEKPQRRAEHARDWATAGSNIIPLREASNA